MKNKYPSHHFSIQLLYEMKNILITICVSFLVGIAIISMTSKSPGSALSCFFFKPFSSTYNFTLILTNMIPLIITGLALSISFQTRVWNLAAEGQVYFGAFSSIAIGLMIPQANNIVAILLILLSSFLAGMLISLVPSLLKIRLQVNELIVSFMASMIMLPVVNYFLSGPLKSGEGDLNATPYIQNSFILPRIFPKYELNFGIIISVLLVVIVYLFLYRTATGTSLRIYGKNNEFARYSGINASRCILVSMAVSGGLCGIAGFSMSTGIFHGRMIEFGTYGLGWNGIAVALVARYNPLGVIPAAFLLSYLLTGSNIAGLFSDIPPEVAQIVISVIYYLVTAQTVFHAHRKKLRGDK